MQHIYDRRTIEQLKVKLQTSIQTVLTNRQPDADDAEIISRAMRYVVTSHNSFKEQYYRINEYLLIMNTLEKKYHKNAYSAEYTPYPMFRENETPF